MCRFLCYKGNKVLLADILTKPSHSLIKQSYCAKMREEPLNGDGFGVGWYDSDLDPIPGLFRSVTPAWGNRNLHRIAEKLKSSCIFAHIRAATPGMLVSEINCHPFQYGRFLWMHNGFICEFDKIKRRLRNSLKDPYYHMIEGTTDSEHAFAVFLNFLPEGREDYSLQVLTEALLSTIQQLNIWLKEAGVKGGSNFNFALTDGEQMVITRYATHVDKDPETLYYSYGTGFSCLGDTCRMIDRFESHASVIVSSEPLTDEDNDWIEIAPNTLLAIDKLNNIQFFPI